MTNLDSIKALIPSDNVNIILLDIEPTSYYRVIDGLGKHFVEGKLNVVLAEFAEVFHTRDLVSHHSMVQIEATLRQMAQNLHMVVFSNFENDVLGNFSWVEFEPQVTEWLSSFADLSMVYAANPCGELDHVKKYINLPHMYEVIYRNRCYETLYMQNFLDDFDMPNPLGHMITQPLVEDIMSVYASTLHRSRTDFQETIDHDHFVNLAKRLAGNTYVEVCTRMTLDSFILGFNDEINEDYVPENEE